MEINNLEFAFGLGSAVRFYDVDNFTVKDCSFKYIYTKTINSELTNFGNIDNNSFYLVGIRGQPEPYGQSAQGEVLFNSRDNALNITNNNIEGCGGVCINPFHSTNLIIKSNYVHDSIQDYTDWSGGIYLDGCNDSVVSYNNVTTSQVGIILGTEIAGWQSARNNVTFNIAGNNIISNFVIDSTTNRNISFTKIEHNTFYQNFLYGGSGYGNMVLIQDHINTSFKNNIIYNNYTNTSNGNLIYLHNGTGSTYGINFSSDYNLWYSINMNSYRLDNTFYTTFNNWKLGSLYDPNSFNLNPLLAPDGCPLLNSPVIGKASDGTNIGACQNTPTAPYTPPSIDSIEISNETPTTNDIVNITLIVSASNLSYAKLAYNITGAMANLTGWNIFQNTTAELIYSHTVLDYQTLCFRGWVNDSTGASVESSDVCFVWTNYSSPNLGTFQSLSTGERALLFIIPIAMALGALYTIMTGGFGMTSLLIFIGLTLAVIIIRSIF